MVIFLGDPIITHTKRLSKSNRVNVQPGVGVKSTHVQSYKPVNNPGNKIIWEGSQENSPLFLLLVIIVPHD